jgi:outer membrane immunogenic protein
MTGTIFRAASILPGVAMAAALAIAVPAQAAELPVKAQRAPAPAILDWTGFYIGANGGGVWGTTFPHFVIDDSTGRYFTFGAGQTANVVAVQGAEDHSFHNSGWTAGGQFGYNNQINHLVLGWEVDFEAFQPKGSRAFVSTLPALPGGVCTGGACTAFGFSDSSSANWLSTVRGRIGWAWDNWLMYATGGMAITHMSFNSAGFNATTSPPQFSGGLVSNFSASKDLFGVALGGGIEWAFVPGWSLGVEYLFVSFDGFRQDSQSVIALPTNGVTAGACPPQAGGGQFCSVFKYGFTMDEAVVRARLNYRFGPIHF